MQRYTHVKNYARTPDVQALPSLIEVQLQSFKWFLENGLAELFDEISPIESYNGNLKLEQRRLPPGVKKPKRKLRRDSHAQARVDGFITAEVLDELDDMFK